MKSTLIPLILAALFTASCKPEKTETSAAAPVAETAEAIPFPKITCLVSGEKLGTMGIPPQLDYHGQQIKFCCKSCIPKFNADPEKYMAQLK
jgi:YHS domain-containing protein